MITQMFPKDFQRYLDLPLLGPLMDTYAAWLFERQYTHRSSRYELRMAAHACEFLKSRGIHRVEDIREIDLEACYQAFRRKFPKEEGSVRVLTRFLMEQTVVQPSPPPKPSPKDILLNAFMDHLRDDRGYVSSTVRRQGRIISEFLDLLKYEETHNRLAFLNITDIDDYIQHMSRRMGRVALQKVTSTLRNFLRFLTAEGVIPSGLESQIDAPRIYRQEKLPRALPWSTVQAFLQSIDRNSTMGKRDYAMFSLMATFGLRACDVVALKLDDIKWRTKRIQICQTKTGSPLELPLIDEVSSALYDYLKRMPRYGNYRQIFLRLKAPGGTRNIRLSAFHSFFRFVAAQHPDRLEHAQRILGIPFKKTGSRVIAYLEYEEIQEILSAVDRNTPKGRRDYVLLVTMFNTGARVQEILDLKACELQLTQPFQLQLMGKGRKQRCCPIWPQTAQLLRQLCMELNIDLKSEVRIFQNCRGTPLSRFGVRYILNECLKHAQTTADSLCSKRLHPHSMRHSTAVALLKSGVDLTTISQWLGHSDPKTTNRYATIDLEMKRKAIESVQPVKSQETCTQPWCRDNTIMEWLESL